MSLRDERKVRAQNLQVGQYIWYMMSWQEIMSVNYADDAILVRFRSDVADVISLEPQDIYEVRGMLA